MRLMTIDSAVGMAVNPFSKSDDLREPDVVKKVEVERDELVDRALKVYEGIEDKHDFYQNNQQISKLESIVLNRGQINLFLQKIIKQYPRDRISNKVTGVYLSKLIGDSYSAGHNDFVLNTCNTRIEDLCYNILGTKEKPIQIRIDGDVGTYCGRDAQHCFFNNKGGIGWACGSNARHCTFNNEDGVGDMCGVDAQYCIFNNNGLIGKMCGFNAKQCKFNNEGDVGDMCGSEAKQCMFNIGGDVGLWCGGRVGNENWGNAVSSAFRSRNRATYEKMLKMVPLQYVSVVKGGNRVILLP